jgi:hypothetical protein
VTLNPGGWTSHVEIEGDYDDALDRCVVAQFRTVHVHAFDGDERTFSWPLFGP